MPTPISETARNFIKRTPGIPSSFYSTPPRYQLLPSRQADVKVSDKLAMLVAELPVEILGEIFVHCLPSLINGRRENSPAVQQAPMLLCRVCVRWREIALGMPILWASFSARASSRRNRYRHASLMKFWLERSQACPLSLELMGSELDDIRGLLDTTFPLFLSEVDRWKRVNLYLNPEVCEQFLAATPGTKPQLEKLILHVLDSTDEQVHQLPTILNKFTQLRQLAIHHSFVVPLHGLRFSALTHIELYTPVSLDRCITILSECSKILELKLADIRASNAPIMAMNIDLPVLVKLELVSDCTDVGEILSHLTCRTLRDLVIDHSLALNTREPYYLNDFLARSSCELSSLTLKHDYASEGEILGYISSPVLRSLRSLVLYSWGVTDRALLGLRCSGTEGGSTNMPLLEKIDLEVGEVSDGLSSEILSSRVGAGIQTTKSPLKYFRVRFLEAYPQIPQRGYCSGIAVRESHKSDVERFKEFCGLGIYVSYIFGC
ncbi:hypothetical protein BDZ94DRAFT_1300834 [Collybia nuda]|uniref:F-box domain-containing protein n=1 Tax=Collybia nuda TaxID=64659 RepID=A0A9P5Y0M3_9AGAR|nr:hypothetical protein BDZ94DRAFT_1300834 [Collybia nuda]